MISFEKTVKTVTECCFCRTNADAKLRFYNLVSSPLAYAWCSSERGRFELVNERLSGHCDEICEPPTDALGSELFMLWLIVIWSGYVHSLGIFWPSQCDGSILGQPALSFLAMSSTSPYAVVLVGEWCYVVWSVRSVRSVRHDYSLTEEHWELASNMAQLTAWFGAVCIQFANYVCFLDVNGHFGSEVNVLRNQPSKNFGLSQEICLLRS